VRFLLVLTLSAEGLAKGDVHELKWMSVNGWAVAGGSNLGSNRHTADESISAAPLFFFFSLSSIFKLFGLY
jgi:6-phosphofructokinase